LFNKKAEEILQVPALEIEEMKSQVLKKNNLILMLYTQVILYTRPLPKKEEKT